MPSNAQATPRQNIQYEITHVPYAGPFRRERLRESGLSEWERETRS